MEEQKNYILKPSLKYLAQIRIVTTLAYQDNIRNFMSKYYSLLLHYSSSEGKWKKIDNKVKRKISRLSLPESLKEELLQINRPICLQIFQWMKDHTNKLRIPLPDDLCWTPQGTVDRKKTAEELIKNRNLDIAKRYTLACIYCLEDDILQLWNKIPPSRKSSFYKEDPTKVIQHQLVLVWTYVIKGEVDKLDNLIERSWIRRVSSPYQYAFELAAESGIKAATEYFLQKLTPREREESLVKSASLALRHRGIHSSFLEENCTDVLCFLLSQMNEEQRIELFKGYSFGVLRRFLDWPWQSFFMETANRMWEFLPKFVFLRLLSSMLYNCGERWLRTIFVEFWQQSPNSHKKYILSSCKLVFCLLEDLFKSGDIVTVGLILKNATVKEKEDIIFDYKGQHICKELIKNNEWELLKFFVQKCISSKSVMMKFKKELQNEFKALYLRGRWIKFLQLLYGLFQEKGRNREESESRPTKKLCSGI